MEKKCRRRERKVEMDGVLLLERVSKASLSAKKVIDRRRRMYMCLGPSTRSITGRSSHEVPKPSPRKAPR